MKGGMLVVPSLLLAAGARGWGGWVWLGWGGGCRRVGEEGGGWVLRGAVVFFLGCGGDRGAAGSLAAACCQAASSAGRRMAVVACLRWTVVQPWRPHPPFTGSNTAGWAAMNWACSAGESL